MNKKSIRAKVSTSTCTCRRIAASPAHNSSAQQAASRLSTGTAGCSMLAHSASCPNHLNLLSAPGYSLVCECAMTTAFTSIASSKCSPNGYCPTANSAISTPTNRTGTPTSSRKDALPDSDRGQRGDRQQARWRGCGGCGSRMNSVKSGRSERKDRWRSMATSGRRGQSRPCVGWASRHPGRVACGLSASCYKSSAGDCADFFNPRTRALHDLRESKGIPEVGWM